MYFLDIQFNKYCINTADNQLFTPQNKN